MPLEDFLHVLDTEVTPNTDPSRVLIIFSGGEVLMRPDLERAAKEVSRRGYKWGMVTNGMALTQRRFEALLNAGLSSISVSFDGFETIHNDIRQNPLSYERALSALRMISRSGIAYDAITCVTPELVARLEEWKELLINQGIKNWRIFSIFPAGRAKRDDKLHLSPEQFRKVMEFITTTRKEGRINLSYACEGFLGGYEAEVRDRFFGCMAGVSIVGIKVDGAISACTSIRAGFDQGNIYEDNLWEVWNTRFEPFRNREWARKGACADCEVWRHCQGGGMHLRDNNGELMYCHYQKLKSK
jgi:radical SAM enzyme (rSAM/lipoprotein system)